MISPQVMTPTFPLEEPLDPKKYVCGRGDMFELNFWGQQNFRIRATVDLEGRTFISKIGYVDIVGKTLAQAREIITKLVHRYYPGLSFDLSLVAPRTFIVHVVGYVPHPGRRRQSDQRVSTVSERDGANASRGLNADGEPTEWGERRLVRSGESRSSRRDGTRLDADLLMYELTGDTKFNPFVMDGDVIRVPFPGSDGDDCWAGQTAGQLRADRVARIWLNSWISPAVFELDADHERCRCG